jgi:hypothetical protein
LRRKPFSATALVASLVWIALSIYEVGFSQYRELDVGWFVRAQEVVQLSALGALGAVALAVVAERIWPETQLRVRLPKQRRVSDTA